MAELAVVQHLVLKTTDCFNCGVTFGMTSALYNQRLNDHGSFYCPNGHGQCFIAESDKERGERLLREEQERHKRTLQRANEATAARDAAKKSLAQAKRRHAAGTCPCCKRTFKQMARHMATKHPEYKA